MDERRTTWAGRSRTLLAAAAVVLVLLVAGAGVAVGRATGHRGGTTAVAGAARRQPAPVQPWQGVGRGGFPKGPQNGQAPGRQVAWIPGAGTSTEGTSTRRQA